MEEKYWTKERIISFIKAYKRNQVLWNTKLDIAKKKEMQRNKWKDLSSEFNRPIDELKKKIKSLRTVYYSEWKKAEISKRNATSVEDIYEPTLFYYKHLQFLSNLKNFAGPSLDSNHATVLEHFILSDESSEDENTCQTDVMQFELEDHDYQAAVKRIKIENEPQNSPQFIKETSEPPPFVTIPEKTSPKSSTTTQCVHFPGELPVISIVWGEKFLGLDPSQRFLAEKAINDILFEASQGNLSSSSTATTGINIRGQPFSF